MEAAAPCRKLNNTMPGFEDHVRTITNSILALKEASAEHLPTKVEQIGRIDDQVDFRNDKLIIMELDMGNYKQDEIEVICSEEDVSVKAKQVREVDEGAQTTLTYNRRIPLPEGTKRENVRSFFTKRGKLRIEVEKVTAQENDEQNPQ